MCAPYASLGGPPSAFSIISSGLKGFTGCYKPHKLLQAARGTFSWCSNAPGMRESALRMLSPWTRLEASTETEDVDDLEAGTLADHHDAQQDLERRYDEINVRTMFDMREDIGDQKVFFLTNHQARLGRA